MKRYSNRRYTKKIYSKKNALKKRYHKKSATKKRYSKKNSLKKRYHKKSAPKKRYSKKRRQRGGLNRELFFNEVSIQSADLGYDRDHPGVLNLKMPLSVKDAIEKGMAVLNSAVSTGSLVKEAVVALLDLAEANLVTYPGAVLDILEQFMKAEEDETFKQAIDALDEPPDDLSNPWERLTRMMEGFEEYSDSVLKMQIASYLGEVNEQQVKEAERRQEAETRRQANEA